MKLKYRFFALALLLVLVFNICKYQIPYIQYGIFKNYIAKNLCIKKEIKNNCCQGKCFVTKNIRIIDENSRENTNTPANNNTKKIQNNEAKEFLRSHVLTPKPVEKDLFLLVNMEAAKLQGFASTVFVPPKN
jgi:hypothetical protein